MQNNNHTKLFFLLTIISLLFLNSCVAYYKTSDVRKSYVSNIKNVDDIVKKMEPDLIDKKIIYKQLISNVPDSLIEPYPKLSNSLKTMSESILKLYSFHTELDSLNKRFEILSVGRERFQADKPEFKDFEMINSKYEKTLKEANKTIDVYNSASNSFISTLNNYKIARIKSGELKNSVKSSIGQIDPIITDVKNKIEKNRQALANEKQSGQEVSEKEEILNELEEMVKSIEQKRNEIENLLNRFEQESGEKTEFWVGPGMAAHSIIPELNTKGAEITKIVERFNKLSSQF